MSTTIMTHGGRWWLVAVCAITLAAWLACDDNPTEPDDPVDYLMYFHEGTTTDLFYSYSPLTGTLDSFRLDVDFHDEMAVSHDGSLLYIEEWTDVAVVSTDSREVLQRLPHNAHGGIACSRDGRYVGLAGDSIWILSVPEYEVVFADTFYSLDPRFSADGQSLYAVVPVNQFYQFYTVSLRNDTTAEVHLPPQGSARHIIPSPDECTWYTYCDGPGEIFSFIEYDLASDSIVNHHEEAPGVGDLEMTPDGRYVFYDSPGGMFQPFNSPDDTIWVYNTATSSVTKAIPTFVVDSLGDTIELPPGDLVVTPDGRRLVAAGAMGGGGLIVLNLETLTIERTTFTGFINRQIWSLTCQTSP